MKLAIVVLTEPGLKVGRRVLDLFPQATIYGHPRLGRELEQKKGGESVFRGDLKAFTGYLFGAYQGIVMIMATGIAVRVIADHLVSKKTDPAVVVIDDKGRFAVSLLSGHLGGANKLAEEIAEKIGAIPVITTSTDGHRILAFDLLAGENNWVIEHEEDLKKIGSFQVEGKEILLAPHEDIHVHTEQQSIKHLGNITLAGSLENISWSKIAGIVFISNRKVWPKPPKDKPYIILRPRHIWAGLGCRKGVPGEDIIAALQEAFSLCGRHIKCLEGLASVELKKEEPGLIKAAEHFAVPLCIYGKGEMGKVEGLFQGSNFVKAHTGFGSVAEPCAYIGSGCGKMILEKTVFPGITVALAERQLNLKTMRERSGSGEDEQG